MTERNTYTPTLNTEAVSQNHDVETPSVDNPNERMMEQFVKFGWLAPEGLESARLQLGLPPATEEQLIQAKQNTKIPPKPALHTLEDKRPSSGFYLGREEDSLL